MKSKFFSAAICLAVGAQSAVSCAAHLSETLDETKLANNRETEAKKEAFDEGLPSKKGTGTTPEDLYDGEAPKNDLGTSLSVSNEKDVNGRGSMVSGAYSVGSDKVDVHEKKIEDKEINKNSTTKNVVKFENSGISSFVGKSEKNVSKNRFSRSRKSSSIFNNKKFKRIKNTISSLLGWGASLFISNKLAERYLSFSSKSKKVPASSKFIPIGVDEKVKSIMTNGEVNFDFLKLKAEHEEYVTRHVALFLDNLVKEFRKEKVDAFSFKSKVEYGGTKEEKDSLAAALKLLPFNALKKCGLFGDHNEDILKDVFDTLVSSEISFIETPNKEKVYWNTGLAGLGYSALRNVRKVGKFIAKKLVRLNLPEEPEPKPVSSESVTSFDDFTDMFWRVIKNIPIMAPSAEVATAVSEPLMKSGHPYYGVLALIGGTLSKYINSQGNQQKG